MHSAVIFHIIVNILKQLGLEYLTRTAFTKLQTNEHSFLMSLPKHFLLFVLNFNRFIRVYSAVFPLVFKAGAPEKLSRRPLAAFTWKNTSSVFPQTTKFFAKIGRQIVSKPQTHGSPRCTPELRSG